MAKFLITGANGQIGLALTHRLRIEKDHDILALKHSDLDITNKNAVLSLVHSFKPDIIINGAAYTHVDRAETEAPLVQDINVRGLEYLVEASNRVNASIFHISTDYVFDGCKKGKYTENDIARPLSIYGKSKAEGDKVFLSLALRGIVLRTSWVFGEYGNNFVKTMLRLAKTREALGVVADQIGGPTYVGDIAQALIQIAEKIIANEKVEYGIYHFTGAPCVSWYDFAKAIFSEAISQNVLKKAPNVNAITTADYPTLAKRPSNSCLDLTKIQQTFGIQPSDWQKALKNIKAYAE